LELCLIIDRACNLRCKYCYMAPHDAGRMSEDIVRRAVRQALGTATGWLSVTLFGGEPLLDPSLPGSVERVVLDELASCQSRYPPPRWLIDTNLTKLEDATVIWLRQRGARLFVSLDGDAEAHDAMREDRRGNGTHALVVKNLRRLEQARVPFELVAVITPSTARSLGTSLEHLLTFKATRISVQIDLRAEWSDEDLAGLAAGARAAAEVWAMAFRSGCGVIVDPFHSAVLSHVAALPAHGNRCELATQELAITPSGRVYPCAEMAGSDERDELQIGDVFEGIDPERVHALRALAEQVHDTCGSCALQHRCRHRCACRQLASSGAVGRITGTLCETEAVFIAATDCAAAALNADRCPTFVDLYYRQRWARPAVPIPVVRLKRPKPA
jgi:uncharacterized protein